MVSEKMYDKLAELVVKKGANVQKDQPVVISANIREAAFVKKIAKYAYEAGVGNGLSVRDRGSAVRGAAVEI